MMTQSLFWRTLSTLEISSLLIAVLMRSIHNSMVTALAKLTSAVFCSAARSGAAGAAKAAPLFSAKVLNNQEVR